LALKPTGMETSTFTPLNFVTLQKCEAACKLLVKDCSWPGLNHRLLEGIVWEDLPWSGPKLRQGIYKQFNRMGDLVLESGTP